MCVGPFFSHAGCFACLGLQGTQNVVALLRNPLHRLTSLEVTLAKLEEMGLKRVAGPPGVDLRLGRGRCVFVRVGPPKIAKRRSLWLDRFPLATKKVTHNKHTRTQTDTPLFNPGERGQDHAQHPGAGGPRRLGVRRDLKAQKASQRAPRGTGN